MGYNIPMNLHVILVHFPIALLTVYAVAELIRFRKITTLPYWFYLKAVLAIIGALAAWAAAVAGSAIEDQFRGPLHRLVEVHSEFAFVSILIFSLIAILYVLAWLKRDNASMAQKLPPGLMRAAEMILNGWMIVVLALVGLTAITVTGALGGAIAFGPQVDPIANFVYNLLGLNS